MIEPDTVLGNGKTALFYLGADTHAAILESYEVDPEPFGLVIQEPEHDE